MGNRSRVSRYAMGGEGPGISAPEAVKRANSRRLALFSNLQFDKRLVKTGTWAREEELYPVWTGTLIAYGPYGEKLPKTLIYVDPEANVRYCLDVPVEARNQKDVALAINHGFHGDEPLIRFEGFGENCVMVEIADMGKIGIVERFPEKTSGSSCYGNYGWHLAEERFGIAAGPRVENALENSRRLFRADTYIGFIVRFPERTGSVLSYDLYETRGIWALYPPSRRFGALAWNPKKEEPLVDERIKPVKCFQVSRPIPHGCQMPI